MKSNTESDARFLTALIASAPVAMYHADATGRLTYASDAYRALFELTADQALDEWAHAVHPEDRERMQQAWADFCRQPHAARFQWRSQSTAGVVRFLVESVAPMSAPAADGFVGTITDVTEYQAIQAQLEKLQRDISGANPALAQLETDLHLAMLLGHLELHYQPKVYLSDLRPAGVEAPSAKGEVADLTETLRASVAALKAERAKAAPAKAPAKKTPAKKAKASA